MIFLIRLRLVSHGHCRRSNSCNRYKCLLLITSLYVGCVANTIQRVNLQSDGYDSMCNLLNYKILINILNRFRATKPVIFGHIINEADKSQCLGKWRTGLTHNSSSGKMTIFNKSILWNTPQFMNPICSIRYS